MNAKPILISGAHRSGSTWVGRMIAASDDVVYIHEPFNVNKFTPGILHKKFEVNYFYINSENEDNYYMPLQKTINLKYDLFSAITSEKFTINLVKSCLKEYFFYQKNRNNNKRVLVKDPIALFSAEWLAKSFDMQPIILIRHPAAFAASVKKKGWGFRFQNFLDQPELIEDHLINFKDEIKLFANERHSIIEQASLLWRIFYSIVYKYQLKHDDWYFIKHEVLSYEPKQEFAKIFDYLGLSFTNEIQRTILSHTEPKAGNESLIKRNSKENIYTWKERLSMDEIQYIKNQVKDVSPLFYSEEDWN